jgi:hypothetical protein
MAAAAVAARTAQAPKRLASGPIPPAPGSPPAAGNRSAARLPARSAFSWRTTPKTRPLDRYDTDDDLSPQLRRRHAYAAETPAYQALSADDFR